MKKKTNSSHSSKLIYSVDEMSKETNKFLIDEEPPATDAHRKMIKSDLEKIGMAPETIEKFIKSMR